MTHIVVYQHTENILNYPEVITLVQEQMIFIGYDQTKKDVESEIQNSMKQESRAALFVAYDENETAMAFAYGNICCGLETKGDYFWLNEIYVSPNFRSKGIGSELLEFVQTWSKEQGCGYLALVTHPKNPEAQSFYHSQGLELEKLVWVDTYL